MEAGNAQRKSDLQLTDLTAKLETALGERLVSVILYGSAAGERVDSASDLNVLCVLDRVGAAELAKSQPIFHWWRERGHPAPLLLAADEVGTSTDCFPIEYHDMQEFRRVLFGRDVIRDLRVENTFYRAQVEHELRAKQIRLRQKSAEVLGDKTRLGALMIHSVSTFCVLGRHALILDGKQPGGAKMEIVDSLEARMGTKLAAFRTLLAARENGKTAPDADVTSLLDSYLGEVAALVRFVDGQGTGQ